MSDLNTAADAAEAARGKATPVDETVVVEMKTTTTRPGPLRRFGGMLVRNPWKTTVAVGAAAGASYGVYAATRDGANAEEIAERVADAANAMGVLFR